MTEHSKIDPQDGKPAGKNSLLERATEHFGLGKLDGAKVPDTLAPPPAKRLRKTRRVTDQPTASEAAPKASPVETPVDAAPVSAAAEPAAPLPRIAFTGKRQTIDRDALRENGFVLPEDGATRLAEEVRIVKRQVLQSMRDHQTAAPVGKSQRVLVCSPLPGEGKTFTSVNLALSLAAEKDIEVVLVDADFAKPSILSTLGMTGKTGLMDALSDPAIAVEDCVLSTDIDSLFVLPAGARSNSDSEYLSSNRTAQVLDRLTQGAPDRIVIFDSPPALAASPAAELADHVAQALLIARADSTGQSALEDAAVLLSDCADIKLVLNAAHFSPSGRRFGDYYGYGE